MNREDLVHWLLQQEPHDLCGRFETSFADGSDGERGSFLFVRPSVWAVKLDRSATMWGNGKLRFVKDSSGITSGQSSALPQRPPWSMVIPRLAPIFGRVGDDWELGKLTEGGTRIQARLSSANRRGSVLVDLGLGILVEMSTPAWSARVDVGLRAGERRSLEALFAMGTPLT